MAGVSTKAIKSRMRSMESTRQITKAMELVAASKLRGAQERAMNNRAYFGSLFEVMELISQSKSGLNTPFVSEGKGERPLYIVIAGDRGMAGGYNNNIFKSVMQQLPENALIFPVGKKTAEYFRRNGRECVFDSIPVADLTVGRCYTLARLVSDGFLAGKYSSVYIAYTELVSLLTQSPRLKKLLPIDFSDDSLDEPHEKLVHRTDFMCEGGEEHVFNAVVPEYMAGVLYCAVKESFASEQAARRTAMDAASKNADEMIQKLNLDYNRARQAAITQEITEIVAGSEK